jgi:AraC-like DNA-binding protein
MDLWKPGQPFSIAAASAGFHDLAHFNHAIREYFALTPSAMTGDSRLQLHDCSGC